VVLRRDTEAAGAVFLQKPSLPPRTRASNAWIGIAIAIANCTSRFCIHRLTPAV
jgi:hypothetical protein